MCYIDFAFHIHAFFLTYQYFLQKYFISDNYKIKLMKTENNQTFKESKYFADTLYVFHKNHKKYLNYEFAKYNISLIQVFCILKIFEKKGINQKDLASGLSLTKGAITKAITKLESNGHVVREKLPEDKRYYSLMLTEKGEELIPVMKEINEKWERELGLDKINPEFLETFKILTLKSIEMNEKRDIVD